MENNDIKEINTTVATTENTSQISIIKHLTKKSNLIVLALFTIVLSFIFINGLEINTAIIGTFKVCMMCFLLYVSISYKGSIGKKFGTFALAWFSYLIIAAVVAFFITVGAAYVKGLNEVENYIDTLSKKVNEKPINISGVTIFKCEKIDNSTVRELAKFDNFTKEQIFSSGEDLNEARKQIIGEVSSAICTQDFIRLLKKGLVYQKIQYDKNMKPTATITIKNNCNITVDFHNKE